MKLKKKYRKLWRKCRHDAIINHYNPLDMHGPNDDELLEIAVALYLKQVLSETFLPSGEFLKTIIKKSKEK
jgi:hypothetical protein